MEQIDSFKIIGISTETTKKNEASVKDLGKLWGRFYSENIQLILKFTEQNLNTEKTLKLKYSLRLKKNKI